jgi:hypothetical protein
MAECPNLPTCQFFTGKMERMPSVSLYLKHQFCKGDNTNCARWMVYSSLGEGNTPDDLFPNEPKRAYELITKGREKKAKK